jgi:sugar/nucleoside kinase (ribokinase family)
MQRKGESQRACSCAATILHIIRAVRIPVLLPTPGSRPFDVVGFGLNSIDLIAEVDRFPEPDTKQRLRRFARLPGGQAATAMVACARLGWKARYIGSFGDDEHGRIGRESLEREGVDISAARTVPSAVNQFAVIVVDASTGSRTILFDRPAALAMTPDDVPIAAVTTGRVVLVDCHDTAAAVRAAASARDAGLPTVIDVERVRPGIEELLRLIDVIITARDFPAALTGRAELSEAVGVMAAEFDAAIVTVTLGSEGSLTHAGGREIRTPAFATDTVDTTGAGDAFRGGFISGWLAGGHHAELEDALEYASAVAALKCRVLGARDGLPTRAEVERFLAAR